VFLGYSSLHKGYKCLHVPSNRVYISRDVIFDENVFLLLICPTHIHYHLYRSRLYFQLTNLWMMHMPRRCLLTMVQVLDEEVDWKF
jgi:hypothetical protein